MVIFHSYVSVPEGNMGLNGIMGCFFDCNGYIYIYIPFRKSDLDVPIKTHLIRGCPIAMLDYWRLKPEDMEAEKNTADVGDSLAIPLGTGPIRRCTPPSARISSRACSAGDWTCRAAEPRINSSMSWSSHGYDSKPYHRYPKIAAIGRMFIPPTWSFHRELDAAQALIHNGLILGP